MNTKLLFALLFVCGWSAAQIKFENGYYINDAGEKAEVLIKNVDWDLNPTSFQYKNSESEEVKTGDIKNVKEFKVYNGAKFVRADVKLDRSSSVLSSLSTQRAPEFVEETLFLKEMVDGNARLYKYREGNLTRYFFQLKSGEITQLIYKAFLIDHNKVAYNNDFQMQLEENFICASVNERKFKNIRYGEKELVDLFVAQNRCLDPDYQQPEQKRSDRFNVNIRPRVNFSSSNLTRADGPIHTDFGSQTNFGLGIEFEYFLPFNNNKWAVIAEPNYQYFRNTVNQDLNYSVPANLETSVDYRSIEIPFGIRYYIHLSDNSKFFINGQYVADVPMNSKIEIYRNPTSLLNNNLDVASDPALAFGLGYNYLNKFAAEFRIFTNRGITADYISFTSEYKSMSIILSYNLF